jgi:lysophospholipase L1-like esterase
MLKFKYHSITLLYLASLCLLQHSAWTHPSTQANEPHSPAPGSVTVHTANADDRYTFSPEQAKSPFLNDFIRWVREDDGNLPRREAVLAVGSSSMRMWKSIQNDLQPLDIIHRGFGGSTMRHVLQMDDFFLRYEAGTVLVYQGDNDLAGNHTSVDAYLEQCQQFIELLRSERPDVKIYFISTKPSPSRKNAMPRFAEANARLAALCENDPNLYFIDVFTPMLDEEGVTREELFIGDRLHLNEAGYELWTHIVRSHLGLDTL